MTSPQLRPTATAKMSTMSTISTIGLLLSSITSYTTNALQFTTSEALFHRRLQDAADEPTLCVCSPTVFNFVLSLSQTCEDNDIQGNVGIEGSFCFVDEGVSEADLPTASTTTTSTAAPESEEEEGEMIRRRHVEPIRKRRVQLQRVRRVLQAEEDADADAEPELEEQAAEEEEEDSSAVVEIISAQFLEFDTEGDLKVIYQDDTYTNVSLRDGDILSYYSKSSFLNPEMSLEEQMDYVPGGASVILYGRTESGALVRNRFFWVYTNGCEEDSAPVEQGNQIGWVTVGRDLVGPWPAFCSAVPPDSPTITPRTFEPTLSPSRAPTDPPVTSPPTDNTGKPTHYGPATTTAATPGMPPSMMGKSGKGAKSAKAKSGKSAKPGKSSKGSSEGHAQENPHMEHQSSHDGGMGFEEEESMHYGRLLMKMADLRA